MFYLSGVLYNKKYINYFQINKITNFLEVGWERRGGGGVAHPLNPPPRSARPLYLVKSIISKPFNPKQAG